MGLLAGICNLQTIAVICLASAGRKPVGLYRVAQRDRSVLCCGTWGPCAQKHRAGQYDYEFGYRLSRPCTYGSYPRGHYEDDVPHLLANGEEASAMNVRYVVTLSPEERLELRTLSGRKARSRHEFDEERL